MPSQIKVAVKIVFKAQIPGTCVTTAHPNPPIATTSHAPITSTIPTQNVRDSNEATESESKLRLQDHDEWIQHTENEWKYIIRPQHDLNGDYYTLSKTPSPPPQRPLRQRLVGTWRLEAYVAYPTPSCRFQRPTFPMTKNVTGLIMYTPDGYMSAHMLIPGQMSFKRGEGEEPQWAEAGKRSFSYAGPYYISDEGSGREEILRHTFQVCNLPGWVGDIQVRTWKFEEDDNVLVLGSEEPTEIRGDQRIPVLKWRRVTDNSNGSPPAPMPHIKVSGPGEP
ncbi:hypothetical protein E4T39_05957 [Aureobasidium subglaciale]|nr:hypothetical protein E4T39_05957 [Aureobasidium subglaciale]